MFIENESIISKADVLDFLLNKLPDGTVERVKIVRAGEFLNDQDLTAEKVMKAFQDNKYIVVRSSSVREDSMVTSNAGHFDSVLHVECSNKEMIKEAVLHVLESYKDGGKEYTGFYDEEVLIQPESENIILAGVVFTRDVRKNRPYFTVNYSADGTTDAVTSGRGGKVVHIARDADESVINEPFKSLIRIVKKILKLTSFDNLDIEFGVRDDGSIVIFQCRPLAAVNGKEKKVSDEEVFIAREKAHEAYRKNGHILSDMAFWNPSEIIGDNPFPLDYSLYREIITSYIWSAGIASMGYHYVNEGLMYKIGNKPYISVNDSFEGLIPEMISPRLQRKLQTYYINQLINDPTAHDKIEFEIVFSVYDFCTDENLDKLLDFGFSKNEINEIRRALFSITELAVKSYSEIYKEDINSLEKMRLLRHEIRHKGALTEKNPKKLIGFVGQLLDSIKSDGTPQFTRMARMAFIAKSFTKTLCKRGYVTEDKMDKFNQSINTVASDFERDFDDFSHGEMPRKEFVNRYGHLRLGTYNIRTDCYSRMYFIGGAVGHDSTAENPDSYVDPYEGMDEDETCERGTCENAAFKNEICENVGFNDILEAGKLTDKAAESDIPIDRDAVSRAISDYELDFDAETLIQYIRKTTENREFFKFEFTKSLSLALNLLIRFGEVTGIERNELSYLEIMDFFDTDDISVLKDKIQKNHKIYDINSCLMFPEIIFEDKDIDVLYESDARPNFITLKKVTAEIAILDEISGDVDIDGKIVVITKADPGYDWIFTRNIAGFISRYGGAASHMAIRCAEFDVPAAIGCGERIFHDVCQMKKVYLNCEKGEIKEA